ncbi:hypothetical protein BX600DRAFT_383801 [Xylariales sp. PMI_506]|nr:hypothetical protein BX600DRAFT_383801 [Xylariales sp. PMI_506]
MQDPSRWTNWQAIASFVPTPHSDTYPYIAAANADFSGKSVLVIGASKGIGKGIALSFAQAGASRIAIGARSDLSAVADELVAAAEAAGRTTKPEVLQVHVDVADTASVEATREVIANAFGGVLDVLVICAGRIAPITGLIESDPATMWSIIETNFKGVYLSCRAFIPMLLESPLRTVIVVGSSGAHQLMPGIFMYQTGKFALQRFIEFVDKDFEEQGLCIIGIHPGDVATGMLDDAEAPQEVRYIWKDTPELAGDTVVWLSKEKRDWLSGRFVSVGWDMKELEEKKDAILKGDLLKFRLVI